MAQGSKGMALECCSFRAHAAQNISLTVHVQEILFNLQVSFIIKLPVGKNKDTAFTTTLRRWHDITMMSHSQLTAECKQNLQTTGTAMRGTFCPQLCQPNNGHMGSQLHLNHNPFIQHLAFFGRYIVDIVLNQDSPLTIIAHLVQFCNKHHYGLSFTYVADTTSIVFLDLELGILGSRITSKNHYRCKFVHSLQQLPPPRSFCHLTSAEQDIKTDQAPIRFITQFHNKCKKMTICAQHWNILLHDPVLGSTFHSRHLCILSGLEYQKPDCTQSNQMQ